MQNEIFHQPKVSIIIPVYNCKKYLNKCIDSALQQTVSDFELILVDDGSTDGSGAVCDEYADKNISIKVLHQENQGAAQSRINGYEASRGQYICFIDSDDYIHPSTLGKMMSAMEKGHPDVVMCQYFMDYGSKLTKIPMRPAPGIYMKDDINSLLKRTSLYDSKTHIAGFPFYMHGKLYKREIVPLFLKAGIGLWYEEDLVCILSMLYQIQKMVVIPDYLYYYVQWPNQITKKFREDRLANFIDVIKRIEDIDFQNHYLKSQLPYRVLMECGVMLTVCAKSNQSYRNFQEFFHTITKSDKIIYYLSKLRGMQLEGKNKIKYELISHKACLLYYLITRYK